MIFFRADGNSKIGAGHVMRCLSIAEAAMGMSEDVFFYTAGNEFSRIIQNRTITNIVLNTDFTNMESELYFFKSEILREKPNVVFVDSYYVTKDYLWSLVEYCHSYGGKVVYIDDVLAFAYPCDFLINYNIYGPDKKQEYMDMYEQAGISAGSEGHPKFLLGLEYVPLRKQFCNLPPRIVKDNPKDILVSTGGADTAHMALAIVKQLIALTPSELRDLKFHILIGAMNEDKVEIEKLAVGCDNIELHFNVKDMLGLMQKCDVAISAAGSTLYELCATQTPTITYVVADNQIPGAEGFAKRGIMKYVGDTRMVDSSTLTLRLLEYAISYTEEGAADKLTYVDTNTWYGAKKIMCECSKNLI